MMVRETRNKTTMGKMVGKMWIVAIKLHMFFNVWVLLTRLTKNVRWWVFVFGFSFFFRVLAIRFFCQQRLSSRTLL